MENITSFPIYFDFLSQKYRSFHPWLAAALVAAKCESPWNWQNGNRVCLKSEIHEIHEIHHSLSQN